MKCPILRPEQKGTSDSTQEKMPPLKRNLERVTRELCLYCGQQLSESKYSGPHGRKKFCNDRCRWAYHNKERLSAKSRLVTMARAVKILVDEVLGQE